MQKSAFLAALQTEIHNHDLMPFVDDPFLFRIPPVKSSDL
jgi:hypothetical protein